LTGGVDGLTWPPRRGICDGNRIRDHDEHPVGPKIPEKDGCLGAMEGALIIALKDDAITDMRFVATYTAVYRLADFVKARATSSHRMGSRQHLGGAMSSDGTLHVLDYGSHENFSKRGAIVCRTLLG
jgi:hypothetical protein